MADPAYMTDRTGNVRAEAARLKRAGVVGVIPAAERARHLLDVQHAVRRTNARATLKPPPVPPATLAPALPPPLVYSIATAAKALQLSEPYIRIQVRKGALKCHKAGTRVLFYREDLIDFVNSLPTN